MMQSEVNYELVEQLNDLLYAYIGTYRDNPHCFFVSPQDYLSLVAFFVSTQHRDVLSFFDRPMEFHGLPVLLKFTGPPEVGPNLKNVKQIAYEQGEDYAED